MTSQTPASSTAVDVIATVLRRRLSDAGATWIDRAIEIARHGSLDALLKLYTTAPLHVGRDPLALDDAERREVDAVLPGLSLEQWAVEDGVRAWLLLERSGAETFVSDAIACYEHGDAREQQSWVRSAGLLPQPDRFLATVIDTCRTNILPLFEAVACDNPYAARFFPVRQFNQLVLKALFNNVALARIVGLPDRLNADLSRMAGDYADERRAAGRSVPADISLAMLESR